MVRGGPKERVRQATGPGEGRREPGPGVRQPAAVARLSRSARRRCCDLAIGAGPHLCLGLTLARRELEVALGRLGRRIPRLRFDEERPLRRWADSPVFRGLESLPVRFDSWRCPGKR